MVEDLKCTCYRLRRADRRVTRLYDAALEPSGVTIVQFSILAALARDGDSGITALADSLGTERTTMTRTLERMQALGWIGPVDGGDARMRAQRLTEEGRAVYGRAAGHWRRAESAMARGMGADRLALLWQLLGEAEDAARGIAGKNGRQS
ncbi:MarR family winged helix-turn-helix transcriptional regulator [Breoghania sp. L-A4]|uniref:MarR family winged helix-turn-helix transcriptional regulator n=1 Tax=Breoghania sp. L-A4 TaxID=2304600 RepID=UPI0013C2A0A1|nr:MarR family winged helix-turn-helix transcriptional regulator [Breoghania sp. L-A4]